MMKARRNIIMLSCVFCYFAGLWIIVSRFGVFKFISRYGLSEVFRGIPKSFPHIEYLYYGLAAYTLVFVGIVYIIYRVTEQAGKEQEILQQYADEVGNLAEKLNVLMVTYTRYAKANHITDKTAEQKLKLLQRQVATLSPSVIKNASAKSALANFLTNIQDQLASEFNLSSFCASLDEALDSIKSLKCKSVIVH